MALHQLVYSFPVNTFTRLPFTTSYRSSSLSRSFPYQIKCTIATKATDHDQTIVRRSANFQTPIWDYDFIQSLRSDYTGESYVGRANKLKADVRMMIENALNHLDQLELIDTLQRLGLAYHFEDEIKIALKSLHTDKRRELLHEKEDLYATALEFRLLRQHGYIVPQEIFNSFKDDEGEFKQSLYLDFKGMLYLYEASYILVDGESILEEARDFAAKNLKEYGKHNKDKYLSMLVSHALELPLHWRMPRMEARWFIDAYERSPNLDLIILELAKLDFNMVQAKHQADIRYALRWWGDRDLGKKSFYARDRMMENALWAVGELYEPEFGYYRKMETMSNALITMIDDTYDVYGTLDELELLTDTVKRWDINAIDQLPEYMKMPFLALFNTINEMAYDILKDQGINVVPSLKKLWGDLCGGYLQEARWYHTGYTPTLQEYLDNAWLTISGPVALGEAFFFLTNAITEEAVKCIMEYPPIVRYSSTIFRLANDLGTSSEEIARGDVPKSIQCYMHETGATEEEARNHIRYLISETWKKLNKMRFANYPFSQTFMGITINLARSAHCFYQDRDAYGIQDRESKDRLLSLFVNPIPL